MGHPIRNNQPANTYFFTSGWYTLFGRVYYSDQMISSRGHCSVLNQKTFEGLQIRKFEEVTDIEILSKKYHNVLHGSYDLESLGKITQRIIVDRSAFKEKEVDKEKEVLDQVAGIVFLDRLVYSNDTLVQLVLKFTNGFLPTRRDSNDKSEKPNQQQIIQAKQKLTNDLMFAESWSQGKKSIQINNPEFDFDPGLKIKLLTAYIWVRKNQNAKEPLKKRFNLSPRLQLSCGIDTVEKINVEKILEEDKSKFKENERKLYAQIDWKNILDSPTNTAPNSNNQDAITSFENSDFIPDYEPEDSMTEENPPKRFKIQDAMEQFNRRRNIDKFNGRPRIEGALSSVIKNFCDSFI